MEDDHVDRPGVEERQRLKLTGTNSSIGLIVLIPNIHPTKSDGLPALTHERPLRAYAPRRRRTTGDAQSRLRASPVGKMQTSPWHKNDDPLDRAATILDRAWRRSLIAPRRSSGSRLATILWIALEQLLDLNVRFADLVVMAERLHPIPFRTRP